MIVGSLIKNPGGGLAPIGGYIVGKKECVENAAYRLTSPGLGKEVGASLGVIQSFYQGFFLAPTVVSGALKGAIFAANIYEKLGFEVVLKTFVPVYSDPIFGIENDIELLKQSAEELGYPIDGMVLGYKDIAYGDSLGATGHHLRSQMAFKFYDEEVETKLKAIDWTMGKTGVLTPTAVFEPVELEGTTVERASLHNVSIMKELQLNIGDTITAVSYTHLTLPTNSRV